ncbi:hypothetical protein BDDG_12646 [Blastomyces dermatitidis ATCC 18188]|uniref:Uncharacterized protein n=1 Tax=Ajellomyces dermatitidis (strain ATCC 18188 / CBS 674.68) TaxID=653446 RepID=A0A0J9HGI6_AJEDA|nr:hypothetical protein BDDG_12646 [Blastomyces dermatitidis ATCC 18188]
MQNLSEGLLKAVRKAAETAELKSKLCTHMRILNKIKVLHTQWQAEAEVKQQLAFTVNQAFTMKSFTNAIIIINKNRENQILEVYTSSETAVQDENLSMKYIKLEDLSESSSFNDD